jgi:hypothetical protein
MGLPFGGSTWLHPPDITNGRYAGKWDSETSIDNTLRAIVIKVNDLKIYSQYEIRRRPVPLHSI